MISDYVDKLAQAFEELGVDYSNMSAKEAEQAYHKAVDAYNQKAQSMSEDEAEAAAMAEYYSGVENIDSTQTQAESIDDIPFQDREIDDNAVELTEEDRSYVKKFKDFVNRVFRNKITEKRKRETVYLGSNS